MKKVLSLVLAFAMILGSFGFVFAGQYSDVSDNVYYSEPVSVLSGLGVVNGVGDGKFDPEGNVTRAQMAVMLVNCLGIPVSGKAETGFTDVPASHWASGWVKYAANVGIIAGYGNGKFGPDDPVTYDQALTMIIASLGYTSEGLGGSWPGNFINQARALGILDTCKTTGSSPASRADICCFLYDALETPMGKTNKDGEFVATVIGTTGFFGTQVYDNILNRLGAHVYANSYTGEPYEIIVTPDVMEDSAVDLTDYLGALITVLVNKDETEIVAVKEVLSTFIEGTYDDTNKKVVGDSTYKTGDASYYGDYTSFDNGEEEYSSTPLYAKDGETVKLAVKLSGTKVSVIYSMQTWTITEDKFLEDDVQEDINDDHKLLGREFAETDDGDIDMNSFALLGRDSLADIAEGDVVYVYVGPDSGKITRVEVGTKTVEGKITKINTASQTYTIAGKAYGLSEALGAIAAADLKAHMTNKDTGTFYLDYAGNIYTFIKETGETVKSYGITLRGWTEYVEDSSNDIVEIFTADGKAEKFTDGYGFSYPGYLVNYTVDEDNVADNVTTVTFGTGSNVKVSKNGLFDGVNNGMKITSSTVVFKYSGADSSYDNLKAAKNYSVEEPSVLFGKTVKSMEYIYDGNTVLALIYTMVNDEEIPEFAFIADMGDETPEGAEFTVLNNGKVEVLNFKQKVIDDFGASTEPYFDYDDPWFLTMKDDVVTGLTDAWGKIVDTLYVGGLSSNATSVSGNVFTSTDGTNYDLASDIIVYVCDSDGNWSIGSKSDLKAKKDTLSDLFFYEVSDDGAFDIAFVIEK